MKLYLSLLTSMCLAFISFNSKFVQAHSYQDSVNLKMGYRQIEIADREKTQQLFIAQNNSAKLEAEANLLKQVQNEEKPELSNFNSNQTQERVPQSATEYLARGQFYYDVGEEELALADLEKAILINPNLAEAYAIRGMIFHKKGEKELAIADSEKAQQLFIAQNNLEGVKATATALQLFALESAYSNAEQIRQNNFAVDYVNQGMNYYEQGEYELALVDFSEAIKINPQLAEAYAIRGSTYLRQEKYTLAKADLEKAHQLAIAQDNDTLTQQMVSSLNAIRYLQK